MAEIVVRNERLGIANNGKTYLVGDPGIQVMGNRRSNQTTSPCGWTSVTAKQSTPQPPRKIDHTPSPSPRRLNLNFLIQEAATARQNRYDAYDRNTPEDSICPRRKSSPNPWGHPQKRPTGSRRRRPLVFGSGPTNTRRRHSQIGIALKAKGRLPVAIESSKKINVATKLGRPHYADSQGHKRIGKSHS